MTEAAAATSGGPAVTLLIGQGSLELPQDGAAPALPAMIEAYNHKARIDGVPDVLNPAVLDPDKAARFVAALPAQPAPVLAQLAGHQLSLHQEGLGLGAATPTRAEAFAGPFTLVIDGLRGTRVQAHVSVPTDAAAASARANQARAAIEAARGHVDQARRMLSVTAQGWRINAGAWAAAAPGDKAAQASLEAAKKAQAQYYIPTGGLVGP